MAMADNKLILDWDKLMELLGNFTIPKPELNQPAKKVCDCGAVKVKTTHSDWCSTKAGDK